MDDQLLVPSQTGRDVAGAWLLCVVIAALTLGLASTLGSRVPPAATAAAAAMSCSPGPGSVCKASAEAAATGVGMQVGSRRPTLADNVSGQASPAWANPISYSQTRRNR